MSSTTIVIAVELDETTDSPSGSAGRPGLPARSFHGWLGLAEAITAIVRETVTSQGERT